MAGCVASLRARARGARPFSPLALLCFAIILLCALAPLARAERGEWSPLHPIGGEAIHMVLLPGDNNPYHSHVLWWQSVVVGQVWGWRTGSDGCAQFPTASLDSLAPWSPGEDIFCGGTAGLGDGRLLTAGGNELITSFGLNDARSYTVGAGTGPGAWSARPKMRQHRWYPTNSTLRDGRVLVTSGSKYRHLWMFGGRRDGAAPASPTGDSLQRFAPVLAGGQWDAPVKPQEHNQLKPAPREGLTGAYLTVVGEQVYFGGKDDQGSLTNDVWFLKGQVNPSMTAADEDYLWTKPQEIQGDAPDPRTRHTAIAISSYEMIVFGGLGKTGAGADTTRSDLWRLWRDGAGTWTWDQVDVTSGTPPTPRYGHSAIWDGPARRMLVYGGVEDAQSPTPNDTSLWVFTFNPTDGSSGSWSEIAPVTNLGQPAPRYGHSMVADTTWRSESNPSVSGRPALMFGGEARGGTFPDTLWALWIDGSTLTWQARTVPGDPANRPSGRARHAALWDAEQSRLIIHGGETAPGSPVEGQVYSTYLWGSSAWWQAWRKWAAPPSKLSGHTLAIDFRIGYRVARIPEVYDPAADAWSEAPAAALRQGLYPLNFVVPGGTSAGGRVLTVGPLQPAYRLDVPAAGQPLPGWVRQDSLDAGFAPLTGAMYAPGKIMIAGGASGSNVVGTTKTVDATNLATAEWQSSADMAPRYRHNLVILPTGEVLVTGGVGTTNFQSVEGAVKRPQIWNPPAGTWTSMTDPDERLAESQAIRGYHSTSLLLPDGRVLCAGGYAVEDRLKADLFCPPYLFNANGDLATRPVIAGAPASLTLGKPFTICVPDTAGITRVALVRPGATTHAFDQNQRYLPLSFTPAGNPMRLLVAAPATADEAPPGYYLLFLTGAKEGTTRYVDVPSIARWVRINGAGGRDTCDTTPAAGITDLMKVCVESGTTVRVRWTAPGDDGSLAASGAAALYDIRRSTSPITSDGLFAIATPCSFTPSGPPAAPGTFEERTLTGLEPSTTYYVRIKTRDDNQIWSALSNQISFYTANELCDEGFWGGSGGGGGGSSAQRVAGAASVRQAEGLGFAENSLLPGVAPGERGADEMRLAAAPRLEEGALMVRLRLAGQSAAALDAARLRVVDHPATLEAHLIAGEVVLGTRLAAAEVTDQAGAPLTQPLDGSGSYLAPAGSTLRVALGAAGGAEDGGTLLLEAAAGPGADDPAAGILLQQPDGSGGWQTLRKLHPRRGFDGLAVPGLRGEELRLEFLAAHTLRFLGFLERASETPTVHWAPLASARSATLGDVRPAVAGVDLAVATLLGPDTLALGFTPPAPAEGRARSYFLAVDATRLSPRAAAALRAAAPGDPEPVHFALHQNQPNPFRGATAFRFDLPTGAMVRLELFDAQGRRVQTLAHRYFPPGRHRIAWADAADAGVHLGPGVYFYRIEAGPHRARRKLVVLSD